MSRTALAGRVPRAEPGLVSSMRWLARGAQHLPGGTFWLSEAEARHADSMRFTKRRSEFLVARWTAKQALCAVLQLDGTPENLRRLEVRHRPTGAPLACVDGVPAGVQLSLTDRADWAVCVVSDDPTRVGCDLELVEARSTAFVRDFLTAGEQRYVDAAADAVGRDLAANLIWSATESALKVLETGLRRDTRSVDITVASTAGRATDGWGELSARTTEGAVFPGWWRRYGEFVLTVVSEVALPAPIDLDDPPLLLGARPTHHWLQQPT
jgi:4'-phosphopantetheinyl transferase